jgi:hypothetical protein
LTEVVLQFESETRNFYRYGLKENGYIITVYLPKTNKRPKEVKVVYDE